MPRAFAIALALLLLAAVASGCEKDEPEPGAPVPATLPPVPEVPQLGDIKGAPAPIQQLPAARDCGTATISLGRSSDDPSVAQCLRHAERTAKAARAQVTQFTIEGDPLVSYVWVRPETGDLLHVLDTTKDRFGRGRWTASACERLTGDGIPYFCGKPLELDDDTPVELLERGMLPTCGKLGVAVAERAIERHEDCIREQQAEAKEFEYRITEPAEEHPIERIVRVTDAGVEVFENSGGYSPDDDRWSRAECEKIGPSFEPSGCGRPEQLGTPANESP